MEKIIQDYVNKSDWRVTENANTGYALSGLRSYISARALALDSLAKLTLEMREAHKTGMIHIHDLDGGLYSPYCYGADLQQLMFEGLKNPVGSRSLPAKHFDSIIDHMVNYLYMSQNEFNGAQAFSNVDTLLAPFVIGKDYSYIKQNVQRLIYNISYPLRSAFQTPFVNFSFDIIPPDHMRSEPIVVGGRLDEGLVYGDLQKEMDLINQAFLETFYAGDSQGKPFTFPIPTYGITKELLNKNDGITDLLWALSAKYGNPNFQNYIGSGNKPSDKRSLCCRLSLDLNEIEENLKSHGIWDMPNKTGSLGVVTINLNQASKDGFDHYFENIDKAYDLSVEELLIKHRYVMEAYDRGLLPFTAQYLTRKDPFVTFFHTVGIAGQNEACINMFEESIEWNQNLTVKMLKHLRARIKETVKETGLLFNLEETPIEGATHRLAKLDRKMGLATQGTDAPYLTNSTHCPVNTIFDWTATIAIQEKFKKYYSGGTIFTGYVGEVPPEVAKAVITQMATKTTIPYYNLTPTYSICVDHGRFPGKVKDCPICGKMNYIYSRVVGYLQPVQKWNPGKKSEFEDRKTYQVG